MADAESLAEVQSFESQIVVCEARRKQELQELQEHLGKLLHTQTELTELRLNLLNRLQQEPGKQPLEMAESVTDVQSKILECETIHKGEQFEHFRALLQAELSLLQDQEETLLQHEQGPSEGDVGVGGGGAALAGEEAIEVQAAARPVAAAQCFPKFGPGPGEVPGARFGTSPMGSGLQGLNGRSFRTERRAMIPKVWQLMQESGFGFLRAPPFSGKTSFIQQVLNHAEAQGSRAFYFNCLALRLVKGGLKLDPELRHACGGTLAELMEKADVRVNGADGCKLVLAIDEAQLLYDVEGSGSEQFFTFLDILQQDPARYNIRVLIAAAYGTGVGYAGGDNLTDTPIKPVATPSCLDTAESIGIHPGALSLQLDPEDVEELWEKWNAFRNLQLDSLVKDQIVAMCASQVGLMVCCLDFLSRIMGDPPADQLTPKALNLLASEAFYYALSFVRSFGRWPTGDTLAVMQRVLWDDTVRAADLDAAVVQRLTTHGQAYVDSTGRLRLTSPLHRAALMRSVYLPGPCLRTIESNSSMLDLLTCILQRLDPHILLVTLGLGKDKLILLRCWQMEVYRAISGLLKHPAAVSPDIGKALGAKGYLNFYISEPYCVGLELTREGSRIDDHLQRFLDPEQYGPMLASGAIKDHVVVDFWCPSTSGAAVGAQRTQPYLYTVQFEEGFTRATIWHEGQSRDVRVAGTATGSFRTVIAAATTAAVAHGEGPSSTDQ